MKSNIKNRQKVTTWVTTGLMLTMMVEPNTFTIHAQTEVGGLDLTEQSNRMCTLNMQEEKPVTFEHSTVDASRMPVYGGASFGSPSIARDPYSGKIYLLANAWPSGDEISSECFDSNGTIYGNGMVKINNLGEKVTDDEEGTYYVGLALKGTKRVSGMEMTHYIKPVEGANPEMKYVIMDSTTNTQTHFTLNANFEVYKDGQPLTVMQKNSDKLVDVEAIPMSIFYDGSEFVLYPVAYHWLITSDDYGITWSAPRLIAGELRSRETNYFVVSEDQGHVLESGEHTGRIVFPIDKQTAATTGRSAIYSDDEGLTWHLSESQM